MNCSVFYRYAEEECERQAMLPGYHDDTFAAGAVWGAMAVFALIGMAEAIAERESYCKACGVWLLDCECPRVYAPRSTRARAAPSCEQDAEAERGAKGED
jgi:hypothetical protein